MHNESGLEFKKEIQNYWTENVPGLDIVIKNFSPEQKEFYTEADKLRYKYEPYVIPLINSFMEKNKLILEVGCGLGSDSRYMVKNGLNVISLDLSQRNVYFTIRGMQVLGLKGKGICSDAENLPFKEKSFDIVYSFGVLHHTPDTQMAINEIYRVLKTDGKCIIMLYHKGYAYYLLILLYGLRMFLAGYNKDRLMSKYDHTPLSKMYSKEEIKGLFNKFNNLKIEMTTYGGIQNHPLLRYVYNLLNKSRFLMNRLGSFLLITARKSPSRLWRDPP